MKVDIKNTYEFYSVQEVKALSSGSLLCFGKLNKGKKFNIFIIKEGITKELDFSIPEECIRHGSCRNGLFEIHNGYGCVFDTVVVFWQNIDSQPITFPITNTEITANKRDEITGPLKVAIGNNENELLVLMQNHFIWHSGAFICKLNINNKQAVYEEQIFSLSNDAINEPVSAIEISDILCLGDEILFHTLGEQRKYGRYGMTFCKLGYFDASGNYQYKLDTNDGFGKFSSDGQHFIIRELRGPLSLTFHDLASNDDFTIRLTPKKVLAEVKSIQTQRFDKYDNKLWLADRDGAVTELELS